MVKHEVNRWLLEPIPHADYRHPMVNTVGDQIREALERLGKSQTWLAEVMGVSDAAVSKWLRTGEVARDRLVDLARTLEISVDQLLTGAPAPSSDVQEAFDSLPDADRQMTLDFLQYRWERAEGVVASEKIARYVAMIERIKADMKRRHEQDLPPPE